MSDTFDSNGLHLDTLDETLEQLKSDFNDIYQTADGEQIDFSSETPDGQALTIFAQAGEINRQLLSNVNASFDPDQASGNILDQRLKINALTRKGGTYTLVDITITVNKTVQLKGLDSTAIDDETLYIVQDDAGNRYILLNTVTINAGSSLSCRFRAENFGAFEVLPDTIHTPVTIVSGVVSINNPLAQVLVGTLEESDRQAKIRRRRSVAMAGTNSCDSIVAAVLDIDGIYDARCYENYGQATGVPQFNGIDIPLHSIWLVTLGTTTGVDGNEDDIANVLYDKNSYGRPMFTGEVSGYSYKNVLYINPQTGRQFYANWDEAQPLPIYLKFTIRMTGVQSTIDADTLDHIKELIVQNAQFNIDVDVLSSDFSVVVQEAINSSGVIGGVALAVEFSTDNVTYASYLSGDWDKIFTLTEANISITVV